MQEVSAKVSIGADEIASSIPMQHGEGIVRLGVLGLLRKYALELGARRFVFLETDVERAEQKTQLGLTRMRPQVFFEVLSRRPVTLIAYADGYQEGQNHFWLS